MRRAGLLAGSLAGSLAGCLAAPTATMVAQVRVNPTGVSVADMSPTTVFLTYGGLRNERPSEAYWCGELLPAAGAIGSRCNPATIYGRLPARYDLSALAGGAFTDVMSIPASVVRAAYEAAVRGATSTFFYVRRFENTTGGADEYVAVTCRLTGGGARAPFSLTDVHLQFGGDDALPFIPPGESPPPIAARITYTGTGRLVGRWEIVLPGEEPPSAHDLLTEGSLPPNERGSQRRFTQLERFDVFLPPDGRVTLPGPDVRSLPSNVDGMYRVLLRIEATDDRENDSDLGGAGAGTGIVHSGAVAGFPLPVLRYVVAGVGARTPVAPEGGLRPIGPPEGDTLAVGAPITARWIPARAIMSDFYRVDFETGDGARLWSALVPGTARRYEAPPWLVERAGLPGIRWRVTALAADGTETATSPWRSVRAGPTLSAPGKVMLARPTSAGIPQ
jgi:hypothetical protein